jgi:transposase
MCDSKTVQPLRHLGVGVDTARYGHHVTFLREDRQPAARPMIVTESRKGYEQLQQQLESLHQKHAQAHFHVRIDAAGQYAANIEAFLRTLTLPMSVSVGEPKRNQDYHRAVSPKRKADATESFAMARFGVVERPDETPPTPPEFVALRRVASRLRTQVRQTTRLINQLHNLMAAAFPELASLTSDLGAQGVLQLLSNYPTAPRIAAARRSSLIKIPYLRKPIAEKIHAAAQESVGTFNGEVAEKLIRQQVQQVQQSQADEQRLKTLLLEGYHALPTSHHVHLESIPGIGEFTAAVLVAAIVSIDRFETPEKLVGYFGVFPEEMTSGVNKDGQPLPPGKRRMCKKGNDLVRGLLWNCAKAAIRCNPAVRSLYRRLRQRGMRGDVALGHAMRKLLHLVFAMWSSGKPFDPKHYRWEQDQAGDDPTDSSAQATEPLPNENQAAGRTEQSSEGKAVTAATANVKPASLPVNTPSLEASATTLSPWVDFAYIRSQISMQQLLTRLGLMSRMRRSPGSVDQFRGPCPVHGQDDRRSRSFSVNLGKNAFRCFYPGCAAQGNTLDLWAAIHQLPLRQAAIHLAGTFNLPLQPEQTEQRNPLKNPSDTANQNRTPNHESTDTRPGVITPDPP